tara:strand:+ start:134 stop:1387 length:1254 start_codon:yes stop_codon:yes gene_type:complete
LVCPTSIIGQWQHEVTQHVATGALRIGVYGGVREALQPGALQPSRLAALRPAALARYDLLLTTFENLRHELAHCQPKSERAMRGGGAAALSLARELCSPLLSLTWWRIVLDEAQLVESSTAKAAEMARALHGVHRWGVSGTPMGRGRLGDLQGLLAFLGARPWDDRAWWHAAIEAPLSVAVAPLASAPRVPARASKAARAALELAAEAAAAEAAAEAAAADSAAARAHALLLRELHALLWRNSKRSVESELRLPPNTAVTHELRFSSIERHFYSKQHGECVSEAQAALRAARARGAWNGAAAERALERLAKPLLRLRQACCHPQLGHFGLKKGPRAELEKPMSMEDVRTHCTHFARVSHGRLSHGRLSHGRLAHARLSHARLSHACLSHARLSPFVTRPFVTRPFVPICHTPMTVFL